MGFLGSDWGGAGVDPAYVFFRFKCVFCFSFRLNDILVICPGGDFLSFGLLWRLLWLEFLGFCDIRCVFL